MKLYTKNIAEKNGLMILTLGTAMEEKQRNKYIKIIHIAKKQLLLNDKQYKKILYSSAGITTSKEIQSTGQYMAIINAMKNLGFVLNTPGQPDALWRCTVRQRKAIITLWKQKARNKSEISLAKFVYRTTGVSHPRWITTSQASQVIVAIKKL